MSTVEGSRIAPATVHVVDDDEAVQQALGRVVRSAGYAMRSYRTPDEFLASVPSGDGCILLDLQLPGSSGLEIQEQLRRMDCALPIVFITGHGDVTKSVRAMKSGAVDFLTKPIDPAALLKAVEQAIAAHARAEASRRLRHAARLGYERLTPREREVFAHLISGQLNKQVAFDLGTAERTIKVHRQRVMEKMGADSVADLVRHAAALGIVPEGRARE